MMTTIESAEPKRRVLWEAYRQHRFGILLVILLVLLAGPPILLGFGVSARWFDGVLLLMLLAAILTLGTRRRNMVSALILGVPTIVLLFLGHGTLRGNVSAHILFAGHICAILFFFGASAMIVRSLFHGRAIPLDAILGAVCGYLFLGLAWSVLFAMIETFRPGSFHISPALVAPASPEQATLARPQPYVLLYYSFVTLTTIGYGDVTPISPGMRTCSWIEAVMGQFYLAIIVAGMVSTLGVKIKWRDRVAEDD